MPYKVDIKKPSDTDITDRDRVGRLMSVVVSSAVVLAFPALILSLWGSAFGFAYMGSVIGFFLGAYGLMQIMPNRMFLYNPEWVGYVTQDPFKKTMVPYGPGLSLTHWWEQRNAENNLSLRPISVAKRGLIFPTKTAAVIIDLQVQYCVDINGLTTAIGVDESAIEGGFIALVQSYLTEHCAKMEADRVRENVRELNDKLSTEFSGPMYSELSDLEQKFGIRIVLIAIDRIGFTDAVQKTRDAIEEAAQLHSVVAKMYGIDPGELARRVTSGEIDIEKFNKMLTRAMAASDNNTQINAEIKEFDFNAEAIGQVVKLALEHFKK